MISKYKVHCKCGFKTEVKYGRVSKKEIYEIFSCPNCKNLFSLEANDKLICKKCKNPELVPYNPHKKENLDYYKRMLKLDLLNKSKLKELEGFWKSIEDEECPICGKKTLKWDLLK